MMNLVSTADVVARWLPAHEAPDASDGSLAVLVEDAHTIISHEFPTLDARIVANELNLGVLKMVVASMVIRAVKQGYEYRTAISETQGPYAASMSFASGGEDARRGVYLTDSERELLRAKKLTGAKIFTATMGEEPGTVGWY